MKQSFIVILISIFLATMLLFPSSILARELSDKKGRYVTVPALRPAPAFCGRKKRYAPCKPEPQPKTKPEPRCSYKRGGRGCPPESDHGH